MSSTYITFSVWLIWLALIILGKIPRHVSAGVMFTLAVVCAVFIMFDYKLWIRSNKTNAKWIIDCIYQVIICFGCVIIGIAVIFI